MIFSTGFPGWRAPRAIRTPLQLLPKACAKPPNSRIQDREAGGGDEPQQSGGFLDSMRETIFGQNPSRGSVPNVRPPEMASRPTWNSGQGLQEVQGPRP